MGRLAQRIVKAIQPDEHFVRAARTIGEVDRIASELPYDPLDVAAVLAASDEATVRRVADYASAQGMPLLDAATRLGVRVGTLTRFAVIESREDTVRSAMLRLRLALADAVESAIGG